MKTDPKDLQIAELQRKNKQLESALESLQSLATLGELSGVTAHEFNNILTLTINYGTATPTVQPATTATLSLTNSCTYYASGHWYSNGSEKRIRQGFVDMGGSGKNEVYGVMWFDRSAINGKTIKGAKITLTRISGYGRSSAVNVRLYTTPVVTTSGSAETGAVDYGILGSIANGETKEFTVPTPAVQALADGTMAGLMLCVNDGALMSGRTYSANYAHYYGYGETTPPELTVTYQ